MASYTWDSSANEAVETSQLNTQAGSTESAEGNITDGLQGTEDRSIQETVDNLNRRNNDKTNIGSTANPEGEVELLSLQRELSQAEISGDFLKIEALSAKCNQLAEALVTGKQAAPDPVKEQQWRDNKEDIEQKIKTSEAAQAALDFAAENMDEEQIESWNDMLTKGSAEDKQIVIETLKEYQANPEYFCDKHTSLKTDVEASRAIVDAVGEEKAVSIITLSEAVANGIATPTAALKLARKDPGLMKSLRHLAKQGLIKIRL